jgi:[NiFe] hydrogenase diaphorase moiety large subunit
VVVGGASGTCVPASAFSRRICFEDVATGGALVVIGPDRDLLAVAENIQEFFADESCGQCPLCRIGNARLLEGIRLMRAGRCDAQHVAQLRHLGETMRVASKCGLGQSSPNVFLSVLDQLEGAL